MNFISRIIRYTTNIIAHAMGCAIFGLGGLIDELVRRTGLGSVADVGALYTNTGENAAQAFEEAAVRSLQAFHSAAIRFGTTTPIDVIVQTTTGEIWAIECKMAA